MNTSAFENFGWIPDRYTGVGNDYSPPFNWSNPPQDAKSYIMIVQDADATDPASGKPWNHWVVYYIPASQTDLLENSGAIGAINLPTEAKHGLTSWWVASINPGIFYQGPFPPSGTHHYSYSVIAVDVAVFNSPDDTGGKGYHTTAS